MKNKKLLLPLACLGVISSVLTCGQSPVAADLADSQLGTLLSSYYHNGYYVKDTKINITSAAVEELNEYGGFHQSTLLDRTTYYTPDALWMSRGNGKYSYYGTDNEGNVTNATATEALVTPENVKIAVKKGVNTATQTWDDVDVGMEGYYITLKDILETDASSWQVNGNVYSSVDADVIEMFKGFTAPCYLGFIQGTENYIDLEKVEIEEVNHKLILRLYAHEGDSGKLLAGSNNVFSQAEITPINTVSTTLPVSQVQRVNAGDYTVSNGALRLDSGKSIQYAIYVSEDTNVDLSIDCWSRGTATTDLSILDVYSVIVNDKKVEESGRTEILPLDTWGSKWGPSMIAKTGSVHLEKGINLIEVKSNISNRAMFKNIILDYNGAKEIEIRNIVQFEAVNAQNIQYPSTDGVATLGINGITTGEKYLSKYTKGSNVRLSTTDYVEFTFVASEDTTVSVILDTSYRRVFEDNRSVYDTFKVFFAEEGQELTEILKSSENAYDQKVNSSTDYGEFHMVRVCDLELKAGVSYTLKLQARINLHLESLILAQEGNATIELA